MDWSQPIRDLTFVSSLTRLEVLHLGHVKVAARFPALAPVARLPRLKKIALSMSAFPLEEYALLRARRPRLVNATGEPYWISPGRRVAVESPDVRATMPVAKFRALPGAVVTPRGARFMDEPEVTYFLGKGERLAEGTSPAVLARRARHAATFAALVASYRDATEPSRRGRGGPG